MHLLRRYEHFLLHNASQITRIESTLRTATYLLPGRFQDAELASETVFAALNLIGLYHDSILTRALESRKTSLHPAASAPGSATASANDAFNRYTRHWWNSSPTYRNISLILTVIQYTEVVVEIIALKRGQDRGRWRAVLWMEVFKAIARLALLRLADNRPMLKPVHPVRSVDPAMLRDTDPLRDDSSPENDRTAPQEDPYTYRGKRTGRSIPKLAQVTQARPQKSGISGLFGLRDDVTEFLSAHVLTPEKMRPAWDLVKSVHGWRQFAEFLHLIRPVIYVLLIKRLGRRDWRPWLISLMVELAANTRSRDDPIPSGLQMIFNWFRRSTVPSKSANREVSPPLTTLEEEEMARRNRQFAWYLFRNPFYEQYTKPRLDAVCDSLASKPLLSVAASILRSYQPLWENLYFYTSSS